MTEIYFCLGFSCCGYYRSVRYMEVSTRRELTIRGLERQEKDFLKSTSNSRITLFFLIPLELKRQIRSCIPSKTIPEFRPKRRKNHILWGTLPPPLPTGIVRNIPPRVNQSSQSLTDSSHSVQNHRYPRVLGLACKKKIISRISLNEKKLFPSYKTVDKK